MGPAFQFPLWNCPPTCPWPPQDLVPVTFPWKLAFTFSTTLTLLLILLPISFLSASLLTPSMLCAYLSSTIHHQNAVAQRDRMLVDLAPCWIPSAHKQTVLKKYLTNMLSTQYVLNTSNTLLYKDLARFTPTHILQCQEVVHFFPFHIREVATRVEEHQKWGLEETPATVPVTPAFSVHLLLLDLYQGCLYRGKNACLYFTVSILMVYLYLPKQLLSNTFF